MSPRQPLDRLAMPLRGRALIEASAGTGKSYTLTALYLRLVLGHGDIARRLGSDTPGFTPQEILVLTFTRAATAELRQAIRARLAEAARVLGDPHADTSDDFIKELLDDRAIREQRDAAAQRCASAARSMDQAAIYTIHGFCQRVLQRFAFAAGHRFDLVLEPDPDAIRKQAVNDYWRRYLLPLDDAILRALAEGEPRITSPQTLWQAIRRATPGETVDPSPVPDVIRTQAHALAAIDAARQAAMAALDAQWDVLQEWRETNASLLQTSQYGKAFNGAIEDFRHGGTVGSKTAKELAKLTPDGIAWKKGKQQLLPAELDCLQRIDDYLELRAHHSELDPVPLLAAARTWVGEEQERQLDARAHISFDTMVTHLRRALEGDQAAALAAQLRNEWPCALVDEFQDTDDDQYAILRAMYADAAPGEHAWFMIGDPKQAIYGFRGASIATYLQVARSDTVHDPLAQYTLDTNYRAARGMVTATNVLFAHSPLRGAELFGDEAIPFEPVIAHDERMTLQTDRRTQPPLTVHALGGATVLSSGNAQKQLASHFARYTATLLASARNGEVHLIDGRGNPRALAAEDITFLVRNSSQAECVTHALREVHIESVFLSDRNSVYAEPEALQLLALLRAVAEPQSGRLLRAALAQPVLACDDATLAALIEDEARWQETLLQFRELHDAWAHRGVLAMMHRLLFALGVPARIAHRTEAERTLTNLLQLAELLQQASETLDGIAAVIHFLECRIQDSKRASNGDENDATRIRLESERKRVRIVTLHGAKGLEYPLVILPFACIPENPKNADDDAARNEEMRLLYVGITRAQHACRLGLLPTGYGQSRVHQLEYSPLGRLLFGNDHADDSAIGKRLDALVVNAAGTISIERGDAPESASQSMDAPEPPLRADAVLPVRRPPYWGITSYSALVHGYSARLFTPTSDRDDEETGISAPTASGIHAVPGGREFGTLVHGLLQACLAPGFDRRDPAALRALVAQHVTRDPWQAQQELISDWLAKILHAPLLAGASSPCLATLAHASVESEFWINTESSRAQLDLHALDAACVELLPGVRESLEPRQVNGMLKGFIDLLFEHDGRYYVLDYKSNQLGTDSSAYGRGALAEALLAHRYELQGLIYLQALHRLLRARLGHSYDPARHLGGCLFHFLRGVDNTETHGLIHLQPTPAQLDAADLILRSAEAMT